MTSFWTWRKTKRDHYVGLALVNFQWQFMVILHTNQDVQPISTSDEGCYCRLLLPWFSYVHIVKGNITPSGVAFPTMKSYPSVHKIAKLAEIHTVKALLALALGYKLLSTQHPVQIALCFSFWKFQRMILLCQMTRKRGRIPIQIEIIIQFNEIAVSSSHI